MFFLSVVACIVLFKFQAVETSDVLYEEVLEVDCRVIPRFKDKCKLDEVLDETKNWITCVGITGDELYCVKQIDEFALKNQLEKLLAKGIKSIAVVLLHSYMLVILFYYFFLSSTYKMNILVHFF